MKFDINLTHDTKTFLIELISKLQDAKITITIEPNFKVRVPTDGVSRQ